jgi:Phytanoyl-CoA dioxygenase (PhyH)
MFKSLRRRLGSSDENQPETTDDPRSIIAQIDELAALDREQRSLERERTLLELRHRAGIALLGEDRPAPSDPQREDPGTDEEGLAVVDPERLDGAVVRGGILTHGYVLVRGLIGRPEAASFGERIEAAFEARAAGGGAGLYEEFSPGAPHSKVGAGRSWVELGGGLLAADSPPLMQEMLDLFDRVGLRRVIAEYLDEPITLSVQKSTLRRADPGPPGGWHQDGSFMGRTRALNVWVALSDCGVDAPGLDFVPRRIDEIVDTGGEGSGAEHLERPAEDRVSPKTVLVAPQTAEDAAGELGVLRPRFLPGDVMLFDDLFLHRTGSEADMPNSRYAIESWFFGASGFPRDYVPLAF